MQVEVQFTNLDKSLAFQEFILKHLRVLAGRLDHPRYHHFSVQVRIRGLAHKPSGLLKQVETEFNIKLPIKGVVVIRKKGTSPEASFNSALKATETVLRRESEKKGAGRRTMGHNQKSVRAIKRKANRAAGNF